MPYGDDITESIPFPLSNPNSVKTYQVTGAAYDLSVNGLPFFVYATDETPYRRQTAEYRKQQIDQSNEPGEQTLTGWWLRSQSSFHNGSGIKFYDPSAGETVSYRFADSKGVDVWTKGQVTLLNSSTPEHETTGPIQSNGRPFQYLRSIKFNDTPAVLLHDEYDVDKIYRMTYSINNKALTSNVATLTTSTAHLYTVGTVVTVSGVDATFNGDYTITAVTSTTFSYAKTATDVTSVAVTPVGSVIGSVVTHFIDYLTGGAEPVRAICDDGTTAYWFSNQVAGGANKLHMFKKPLTGSSASTADETTMYTETGLVITNAVAEYIKDRIVACINNKVYEISPTGAGTALPNAVYTHPVTSYIYTSITASGPAIYVAGYNGIQSAIQKFTLSTAGAMPALTSAVVAAEMPVGEIIYKIFYYLGRMLIGTNKGIRAAEVSDVDGSIKYGPLIVETTQPVYDFTARDRFVWAATSVAGEPGITRLDLGAEIEPLRFAYANDLYYASGSTAHPTVACAFLNGTDTMAFTTAYAGSSGYTYIEQPTVLLPSGSITTGRIRYSTLEPKVFKIMNALVDNSNGGLTIESIDTTDTSHTIGNFAIGDYTPEVNVSYPVGAQQYMSFKFTISRNATTTSLGAIFDGYQLKSLPAVPRQRIIQFPLACYDNEKDRFNVQTGHEGSAYQRLGDLEALENVGDSIRIDDFRTGESVIALIESISFVNQTSGDKRFSGFGGIAYLTIRTL